MDDITNTNIGQMAPEDNKPFSERHHHFILSVLLIGAILGGGWYLMKYKPWGILGGQKEEVIVEQPEDINTIDSDLQSIDIETLPQETT